MRGCWILFYKEVRDALSSPLIYVLTALFSALMGWLFFNYLVASGQQQLTTVSLSTSVLAPIFGNMNFVFLFFAPLLTMRLFAEEKKLDTLNLLFLSELTHLQIIFAKFLSALFVALFMLSMTLVFPLVLAWSGYSDWGTVLSCYLGIVLSLMCYLSVGLFASSLTENQIVAAVLGFCLLLGLMLMVITAQATHNPLVAQIFQYMSPPFHYESFVRGTIKSFNLIYVLTFMSFFFYCTHVSLESRKW